MRKRHLWLVSAVAAVAVLAVGAAPSVAGKPVSSAAKVTGSVSGDTYTVVGTGFKPNEFLAFSVGEAGGCCRAFNMSADESGAFTLQGSIWGPGKYSVTVSSYGRRGWTVAGVWSFTA